MTTGLELVQRAFREGNLVPLDATTGIPVVNDGQTGSAVDVRVSIRVGGASVGRPACMGNAYATQGGVLFDQGLEPDNLPYGLAHVQCFPIDGRYSGRIVSPVLEPAEGG